MIGVPKAQDRRHYVCGSQPYRKGMGCGPGVYVPKEQVEEEVVNGLRDPIAVCSDPRGFARMVNDELRRLWEKRTGYEPAAGSKLEAIDRKIANVYQAIEGGLADVGWANERLSALGLERKGLTAGMRIVGELPQISVDEALTYRRQGERILTAAGPTERKQLLRKWVTK